MITFGHEKNELLKQSRGIGFEEIIAAMNAGKILDVFDHPDQVQYPRQKIYVVEALDYVYLVAFLRNEDGIFLKNHYSKPQSQKTLQRGKPCSMTKNCRY